jgi:hypothetical protein
MIRISKIFAFLLVTIIFTTSCTIVKMHPFIDGEQQRLYLNEKFGFNLQIPISWDNHYIIHEYEDCIEVCFVGESATSKQLFEGSNEVHGLSMFFIGNEACVNDRELIDSVYEVGEVKGVKFFHFTGTDYALGALRYEYIKEENEIKLANTDLDMAKTMEVDKEYILRTFKEN